MVTHTAVTFSRVAVLFSCIASATAGEPVEADDVKDVPSEEFRAGGEAKQRFFLIGAKPGATAPEGGYGLVLVLAGGDGSEQFHPFVKRIWKNALPEGYLVAQLVAVPSDDAQQITWPTEKSPHEKQKFSTEAFVKNVVKDVGAKQTLDKARVFTLSWSSGGPAAYAVSLTKDSPVKGSLVAMSVFVPQRLPPLQGAKGHRYFVLHSPDDMTCRYFFTRMAKTQLGKAGAKVEVLDYAGGHGWKGDVFGNIRTGIEWLQKVDNAAPK